MATSADYHFVSLAGNTAGTNTFHATNNRTIHFAGGNNITLSGNGSTITISGGAGGAGFQSAIVAGANGTGTFTNTLSINAGNNVTLSTGANAMSIHVAAPGGGATYSNYFEPFCLLDGTATTSGTLSQLNLQPFTLHNNLTFGQIKMIGIGTMPATSVSNSHSGRLTNSTQRYAFTSSYTIGNTNLVDLFLFKRGTGDFSTELETFASTRNSFATNYWYTYFGDATLTNAAGGSLRGSQTISMTISYPFMTSAQSINGASTHTTWQSGYTTWTSAANNSSSFTFSTSAARTLSIGSTFPATLGWSGAKLINLNFATSLSPGEYWLGMMRHSSSSGSSTTSNAFTGAAGTGNSYSASVNSTGLANTQQITWAGKTNTVVNSLGSLGFATTNNMAPAAGLGSFSGTWASNTTYLNNAANPAGAVCFTQLRTGVSFFRSWFEMGSNRFV